MKHLWFMLAVGILAWGAARADDPAAAKDLRARRSAYDRAYNGRSLEALMEFVDPAFRASIEGHPVTYQQWRDMLSSNMMLPRSSQVSASTKIERATIRGDRASLNVVVEWSHLDAAGHKMRQRTHQSEVWRKIGGRWLLTA